MSVKDGRIFGGNLAIVNQLLPHKNKWAWDLFIKSQANNWTPTEVTMAKDVEQWRARNVLTDDERLLLRRCLGFFAGTESLVANNLLLSIFKVVSDAECRQYILRQAYEESLHNQTILYICDSLDLDIKEVYEAYLTIPSIKAKDDFLISITTDMSRNGFAIEAISPEPKYEGFADDTQAGVISKHWHEARLTGVKCRQEALRNLIAYYIICEGLFFYSGFAMLLSFGRQNKMTGVSEQIQFTLRDESVHIQFGTQLIQTIIQQEPSVWTRQFKEETVEHIRKATELEIAYAHDVLPRGILGMKAESFIGYMEYIANRRLESLGLPLLFKSPRNPFPWLTETIDLIKQKNFFETRVTEYQVGGTMKDDMD